MRALILFGGLLLGCCWCDIAAAREPKTAQELIDEFDHRGQRDSVQTVKYCASLGFAGQLFPLAEMAGFDSKGHWGSYGGLGFGSGTNTDGAPISSIAHGGLCTQLGRNCFAGIGAESVRASVLVTTPYYRSAAYEFQWGVQGWLELGEPRGFAVRLEGGSVTGFGSALSYRW